MNFKIIFLFSLVLFLSLSSVSAGNIHNITNDSYSTYFNDDGDLINSNVGVGDTLDLHGNFVNKNFTLNKPLNFTSTTNDVYLNNCTVLLTNGSSGSSVSNLVMFDTRHFGESIVLSGSCDNHIFNNHVTCITKGCPLVLLPDSDYNLIENNFLNTTNDSWDGFHESLVVFASDYNIIRNNLIYTGDDNGIYLSTYGRSGGVKSYFNSLINNTIIRQGDVVSAWNYGIQVMGDSNLIANNTVYDSYRGISTTNGVNNSIIGNTIINAVGDYALFGSINCTIINNTISDCSASVGVFVDENSTVTGNVIEGVSSSKTISMAGSNILIKNNNIKSSSIAIYGIGKLNNITIDSNNLTTLRSIVIQLKKQSNSKKPTNITITKNIITSNAGTIIDLKEADTSIIYENNTYNGEGKIILPEEEIIDNDNETDFNGTKHIITPENYDDYFDSNGIIRPNVVKNGDIIIFNGEFENKFLNINTRLWIIGDNATFRNSTFRIIKKGCTLENLTIINNNPNINNQWGIYVVEVDNISILNNIINITDNKRAYTIYLIGCKDCKIQNNKLFANGTDLTYPILTYETSHSYISNNNIYCIGTGVLYNFTGEHEIDESHTVPEIYNTYGILTIFSSNMQISDNNVYVTSNILKPLENNNDCTNSLVGIDIYFDSHNNDVRNNNITVTGYDPYIYGTGVLGSETGTTTTNAKKNTFAYNNIYLNGTFFVSGIITGCNSLDSEIYNNNIRLNSQMNSYGITFEESQTNTARSNNIIANSTIIYLIEMYQSQSNRLINNNITGYGGYVYGIAGYQTTYDSITNNNIQCYGNNKGLIDLISHTDIIEAGNCGIKLLKGSNENGISYNNITTTGEYSIQTIESEKNRIRNNLLKSANYTGDESVNADNSNVYNNSIYILDDSIVNLIISDLNGIYGENNTLTGSLTDAYNKGLAGFHISLKLTRLSSGASKTYDVVCDFTGTFNLPINLATGSYKVDALFNNLSINNKNYKNANAEADINIFNKIDNRTSTIITVYKFNESYGAGKSFTGILTDLNNNTIIGHHVSTTLTRLSSGASKTYVSTSDYNGIFKISINLAPGRYLGVCTYEGTDKYAPSSGSNTITIY